MSFIGSIKLLVVALYLSLSYYGVEGGMRVISKEEDLEFERQLKSLNKPPVKTFQTEVGDIVDCIDIHKQPAFDHPLLKNHEIQIRPTSRPQGSIDGTLSINKHSRFPQRNNGCPQGTVPIRRTRKEDLIRAKSFSNSYASDIHPHSKDFPGQHIAILRSKDDTAIRYKGVQGRVSINNPRLGANESSSAEISIENGPADQLNRLQAGWMVAHKLFGDYNTRLFIFWTLNGGKTGCYNLLCNGFIQTSKDHMIGGVISPISRYGGDQFELRMSIFRDESNGNWWFTVQETHLGYWPMTLLPNIGGGASRVSLGGSIKGPPIGISPPMGNGYFPDDHYDHSAWFKQIEVVNASFYWVKNPRNNPFEIYVDCPEAYGLKDNGYRGEMLGRTLMFGGPGGICGL